LGGLLRNTRVLEPFFGVTEILPFHFMNPFDSECLFNVLVIDQRSEEGKQPGELRLIEDPEE